MRGLGLLAKGAWGLVCTTIVCLFLAGNALAVRPGDGEEISRSLGKKGGIVVLWPRLSGAGSGTAALVQGALVKLAQQTTPLVDVRPSPERACPRDTGCRALTLGAVVVEREQGCAVVATVTAPGLSPTRVLDWAGVLSLSAPSVAFREAPETAITVADFVPCDTLPGVLDAGIGKVAEVVKGTMGGGT